MADNAFTELRSPRLVLRRLRRDDLAALCAYRSLPEVARYQAWESFGPEEAARLIDGQAGLAGRPGDVVPTRHRRGGDRAGSRRLRSALPAAGPAADGGRHHPGPGPSRARVRHRDGRVPPGLCLREVGQAPGGGGHGRGEPHRSIVVPAAGVPPGSPLRRARVVQGGWGSEFVFALLRREWEQARTSRCT
jgi:hypothetical protein